MAMLQQPTNHHETPVDNNLAQPYLEPVKVTNAVSDVNIQRQAVAVVSDNNGAMKSGYRPVSIFSDNKYEELPGYRPLAYSSTNDTPASKPPLLPPSNHTTSVISTGSRDSQEPLWAQGKPRKRLNPLFNAREAERSTVVVTSDSASVCSPLSWLWCALHILIAAIAIAALILAIVTRVQWQQQGATVWPTQVPSSEFTNTADGGNVTSGSVFDQLNVLREQYNDLLAKYNQLSSTMSLLTNGEDDLNVSLSSLQQSISTVNSSLLLSIANVTKMQGPPGAGNLTGCTFTIASSGSASFLAPSSQTPWRPVSSTDSLVVGRVIMSVACSTSGGQYANVLTQEVSLSGVRQYMCKCYGQDAQTSASSRDCNLFVWTCPALS